MKILSVKGTVRPLYREALNLISAFTEINQSPDMLQIIVNGPRNQLVITSTDPRLIEYLKEEFRTNPDTQQVDNYPTPLNKI